mmetsp:Transcript_13691/g.30718  ORF Transcript_13691/g.30718 Transcript_13691/m.30718 type:complete len:218 (+) Transcript_13691:415-1068(+)
MTGDGGGVGPALGPQTRVRLLPVALAPGHLLVAVLVPARLASALPIGVVGTPEVCGVFALYRALPWWDDVDHRGMVRRRGASPVREPERRRSRAGSLRPGEDDFLLLPIVPGASGHAPPSVLGPCGGVSSPRARLAPELQFDLVHFVETVSRVVVDVGRTVLQGLESFQRLDAAVGADTRTPLRRRAHHLAERRDGFEDHGWLFVWVCQLDECLDGA